jgi:transposase InsO family protein
MCRLLKVSASGFYQWLKSRQRPANRQQKRTARLMSLIQVIHAEHKDYGSPRIQRELIAHREPCNVKTVARLMQRAQIRARRKRRFVSTTDSSHRLPIAENLLNREFTAEKANQKWVADTTFIDTSTGWIYLTTILDLFSRKIVGWKIGDRIDAKLAAEALQMAIALRQPKPGLIIHTDRGSQFCSETFQNLISEHDFLPSMSRKGNCWDNAVMESFYRSLKTECVYWENYVCQLDVQRSLNHYIEQYYNRIRLHSSLGYVSPVKFELVA